MNPGQPIRVGYGVRAFVAVLLAGTVASLMGCSTASAGPTRLAPAITLDQLDVTAFGPKPCDLLRADRASRRHLATPGTQVAGPNGLVCRWNPTAARVPVFTAGVDLGQGLEEIYRHYGEFSRFEPTDIANYPAVHTEVQGAGANGRCATRVAVADNALLVVTADNNGLSPPSVLDPCSDADTLATEIMGQLLAGSP